LPGVALVAAGLIFLSASFGPEDSGAADDHARAASPEALVDRSPDRIVGADACAECHVGEHRVWMETAHQKGSRLLTRSDLARDIAQRLGVRRIKADERCVSCHYTEQAADGRRLRAVSGVSCESCHGAAEGWMDPHSRFGGGALTAAEESPVEREERMRDCQSLGMVHTGRLFELAGACHDCHTINDPELIEAGHPTGEGFEFVAWSQGVIRHNFVREGSDRNPVSAPERRRVMLLAGAAAGLEHAMRGPGGDIDGAVEFLERLHGAAALAPIEELIGIGRRAQDAGVDTATIERVRAIGRAMVSDGVGADTRALDGFIGVSNSGGPR